MLFLNSLISPISIAFAVIIFGYYLGRIKILGVSLDLAGVLIMAVAVGWILNVIDLSSVFFNISEFQSNMKFFSSFGTALFVSVIGITTGYSINVKKWKDMKAAAIGSLMIVSAFLTMRMISLCDADVSISKLMGSLCGALTTTPGLSAVCELANISAEEATLGYGCAYLFGVVATVLFVQITTRKSDESHKDNVKKEKIFLNKVALDGFVQICFVVLIGRLFGNISVLGFSLGNSGGMLCVGILMGAIIKKGLPQKIVNQQALNLLRNLGLVLFFVGNGIPAGMKLCSGFEVKIVLYGAVMTIIPILVGVVLYRLIFTDDVSATVVSGGMTSTPAICVLMQKKCNIQLSRYSLAYVGALITIIIFIQSSINHCY